MVIVLHHLHLTTPNHSAFGGQDLSEAMGHHGAWTRSEVLAALFWFALLIHRSFAFHQELHHGPPCVAQCEMEGLIACPAVAYVKCDVCWHEQLRQKYQMDVT